MNPTYIDTEEAAALLRKPSRQAVRKWAVRRGMTVIKDGGRWLFYRPEIEAYLKLHRVRL